MMIWILIWIAGTEATFAGEFGSKEACQAAGAAIVQMKADLASRFDPRAALCVPKS